MIREYKDNDLNSIMKLWLEANTAAHNFIDENYWRSNCDNVKQMIPEATIFVYEDNSVKGFVGLSGNYIAGIFIDTNYQSQGIGKLLLDYIKARNEMLILKVYKKNRRAVRFYLREGFVIDDEKIDEITNEIELVMKWGK